MAETPGLAAFLDEIAGIEVSNDPFAVRKHSRDYYWFSPVLKEDLAGHLGECVVWPASKDEVVRIAAAAARHRVPLTPRGAGTGTFGQAVPLAGGAILDMARLDRIVANRPGSIRAEAGTLLGDIDAATRPAGWELRIHPSTKSTSTLGGFIAGGHAGVGVINYGIMRDRGNILGIEIVTLEETPRVEEVRGDAIEAIHHAYGVNGIITEVELPLAPAHAWQEVIVAFPDFMDATRLGLALVDEPGIVKKLASAHAWPIPQYFRPLAPYLPEENAVVFAMVAAESLEAFRDLVADHGGILTYVGAEGAGPRNVPLYEYCWGHTTLNAYQQDRAITYLACVFDPAHPLAAIERVHRRFNDVAPLHLEFIRFAGRANAQAVPLVKYESREQIAALTEGFEAEGAKVANVHTYLLQNGGMKRIDDAQLALKARNDPHGLLNPGKVAGYHDVAARRGQETGKDIHAAGWAY